MKGRNPTPWTTPSTRTSRRMRPSTHSVSTTVNLTMASLGWEPDSVGIFSEATAVTPTGAGEFGVTLDAQWAIADKLHGGYLLAVVARAAGEIAEHPYLTAISGSFPAAPKPGDATVR